MQLPHILAEVSPLSHDQSYISITKKATLSHIKQPRKEIASLVSEADFSLENFNRQAYCAT